MKENLLNHYLQAWNLSDPQPLTETPTSHLYTVRHEGETVVLKLLTDFGWAENRGAAALVCFGGHGAVRLYQHDEKAQLIEYADGADLVTLVESGDDAGATRIIAEVLNQLHSGQSIPCEGVLPLDRWFEALFSKAAADEQRGVASIYGRGARVARHLLADPRDIRVLHGDIYHENIRHKAGRGWLAFDAKGLIGERTYDCCNTLCNPYLGHPIRDPLVHNEQRLLTSAGILADTLGIDLARVLAFTFAYACLNTSHLLSVHNDEVAQWMLGIAEIVEPHLHLDQ